MLCKLTNPREELFIMYLFNNPSFRFSPRILFFSLLFVSILLFSLSPLSAQDKNYPISVTDTLGNEVSLQERPEKVILAGKATLLTTNVFFLFEDTRSTLEAVGKTNQGLGDFLPYIDEHYNSAAQLSHQVGPEQILAHQPDLVIVKDFVYSNLGKQLQRMDVPVLALSLETPEDFRDDIRTLGTLLNQKNRAEEIVNIYDSRLKGIREVTEELEESEKPSTLLLYYSVRGGETSFNIAPKNWIQTFQVEAGGGEPVWTDNHSGGGWKTVNFEQIAAWDPDHIFITSFHTAPEDYMEDILENSQWEELRAARNGKVEAVPADFYSWAQPDTRWILGLQWMATRLHPELFSDLDMRKETEEFYRELYDIEEETFDDVVLPRLEEALSD
ncbi:MAG: ABC transporter substrate-binding protein [Spirochaetia bacterium]